MGEWTEKIKKQVFTAEFLPADKNKKVCPLIKMEHVLCTALHKTLHYGLW